MKAYCFDENHVFVTEIKCELDPLEKEINNRDIYLLPANATFKPVPIYNAEIQYCVFDGEVWKIENYPAPKELTPEEKRRQAYQEMLLKEDNTPLLIWINETITVDQANRVYLEYFAEGSEKAAAIQLLIIAAKSYIRDLYPDEVV